MFESVDVSHIYRFVLQECNYGNQQDKTQLLMKTAWNRWNRLANGMKQVSQHGWIIVHKTYFSLVVPRQDARALQIAPDIWRKKTKSNHAPPHVKHNFLLLLQSALLELMVCLTTKF